MAAPSPQIDASLLHRLLEATVALPIDALAAEFRLPAAAIARRLDDLRQAGCDIDAHPHHGVRLLAAGLGCWADYIEPRHAAGIGRRLAVYRRTASTQDTARQLVAASPEAAIGTVVAADHQTAGRGRLGRRWFAPPGSALLVTAIVDARSATADRLVLGSCCALGRAVERLTGLATEVRWPNDLLVGGRKLAGILVETVGPAALIGIGVNLAVDPADLPADDAGRSVVATSLTALGRPVDRLRLLDTLLTELDAALAASTDDDELRRFWRDRSCLIQQRITVSSAGRSLTGRVIDVDPQHGLILEPDAGPILTIPAATASLVLD